MRTSCAVYLILAFLLVGCGGSEPEEPEPAAAAPPSSPSASREPAAAPPPIEDVQVSITPVAPPGVEGIDTVREYTRMFYSGELEKLFEKFSPEMRTEILPLDKLRAMREQVRTEYGEEIGLVGEDAQTKGDYRGFARWARFSKHDGIVEIRWILRPDDSVAGFLVMPAKKPQRKQP